MPYSLAHLDTADPITERPAKRNTIKIPPRPRVLKSQTPPRSSSSDTLYQASPPPAQTLLSALRAKPETLMRGRAKEEWPEKSPKVEWVASGIETVLPPVVAASPLPHLLILRSCIHQDRKPINHMARRAVDASDPDNPLCPPGVRPIAISKFLVAVLYHPEDYAPEPVSLECLLFGSGHAQRVAEKGARLNAFVSDLRKNLAKGVYILVRGWKPAFEVGWDEAAVEAFKGSLQQPVQYQGQSPVKTLASLLTLTRQMPASATRLSMNAWKSSTVIPLCASLSAWERRSRIRAAMLWTSQKPTLSLRPLFRKPPSAQLWHRAHTSSGSSPAVRKP